MLRWSLRVLMAIFLIAWVAQEAAADARGKTPKPELSTRYVVTELQVTHGLPVAEYPDGIVYSANTDTECQSTTKTLVQEIEEETRPPSGAIATVRSDKVTLQLTTAACETGAPAPKVDCHWIFEPNQPEDAQGSLKGFTQAASCRQNEAESQRGKLTWEGWQGTIELPPTGKTGIYTLDLSCRINTSATRLRIPLYATYAEPLTVVMPPEVSWYSRASCWSAGLDDDSTELDVLTAVREGIYTYGNTAWRYGYATQETASAPFIFPLADKDEGSSHIQYDIDTEVYPLHCNPINCVTEAPETSQTCAQEICPSGKCKCHWQGMVGLDSACDFGDCYVFSDVLQSMSAVMGVGGLRYIRITGRNQLGFVTVPGGQSVDPKFTGCVACTGEHQQCYPYFFGNHSLRLRDGIYQDSTFNRAYDSPLGGVGLEQTGSLDSAILLENDLMLWPMGSGYGNWNFFTQLSVPPVAETSAGQIELQQDVTFCPNDKNDDGIYDYLVATFEAKVTGEGSFVVRGRLSQDDRTVAIHPNWRSTQPTAAILTAKQSGNYQVSLYFSGQEIRQAERNGQFLFEAIAVGEGLPPDSEDASRISTETQSYQYREFGELDVYIEGNVVTSGVEADDGRYSALKIEVPLEVESEGVYAIEARLAKGSITIAYQGSKQSYPPGKHIVTLEIPGAEIAESGFDSPYALTVVSYGSYLEAQQSRQQWVRDYQAADFE